MTFINYLSKIYQLLVIASAHAYENEILGTINEWNNTILVLVIQAKIETMFLSFQFQI